MNELTLGPTESPVLITVFEDLRVHSGFDDDDDDDYDNDNDRDSIHYFQFIIHLSSCHSTLYNRSS